MIKMNRLIVEIKYPKTTMNLYSILFLILTKDVNVTNTAPRTAKVIMTFFCRINSNSNKRIKIYKHELSYFVLGIFYISLHEIITNFRTFETFHGFFMKKFHCFSLVFIGF